jgi:membrane-associated protein
MLVHAAGPGVPAPERPEDGSMEWLWLLLEWVRNLGENLNHLAGDLGPWFYVVMFLVIFAETGLIVTPFLPGDSLLFALGALTALPSSNLSLPGLLIILTAAAILGDALNYAIGYWVGPAVFRSKSSWLFNVAYLQRAQEFYERYGGKTIIIARFVPIVRTFAPFVAGIGQMRYRRFFLFNLAGALLWVGLILPIGYAFGNLPVIKKNFSVVIFAIIGISLLPAVIELLRDRRARRVAARGAAPQA